MGLFSRKAHPFQPRAENLVSSARTAATFMHMTLLPGYPVLKEVDLDRWYFVLTVAGVKVALLDLLYYTLPTKHKDALIRAITDELEAWNLEGLPAVKDCLRFWEDEVRRLKTEGHSEPQFLGSDALGIWVVRKLLQRPPHPDQDEELVRVVGAMVVRNFSTWWS